MGNTEPKYPKIEISKLLRGQNITSEELEAINRWYYTPEVEKEEIKYATASVDPEEMLQKIHLQSGIRNQTKQRSLLKYTSIAAVFLLILLAGWGIVPEYFFQKTNGIQDITKVVETSSGERKKGFLPDGSAVYLRENSSIAFTEGFRNGRKVTVKGEVFFEVKRSETDTFRVLGNQIETKVLGTEFLVSDKRNNSEMVLVKSGKVSVAVIDGEEPPVILEKNGKAKWNQTQKKLLVTTVSNEEKYFSWIEGTLVIDRANTSELAKEIEDWFGVEVINLADDNECVLSGAYQKMSIEEVMETINYSVDLNYEYNEGKLIIKSMKCK